ncbi:acetyltransferase GNAT family [Mycoplasma sp. CAG:776]|nr:acetyltransferase GNAT family [Mycoplasma sp. CAG:776]
MIRFKKAKKKDKPMLINAKLLTLIPYIKDNSEQLKAIAYVNDLVLKHVDEFMVIYSFIKPIGVYLIKDKELDTLYIEEKYRNKGYGSKILKKIKDQFIEVKVRKENKKAIEFYKRNGYTKEIRAKELLILRKD